MVALLALLAGSTLDRVAAAEELLANGELAEAAGDGAPAGFTVVPFGGSASASVVDDPDAGDGRALLVTVTVAEHTDPANDKSGYNPMRVVQVIEPAPVSEIVEIDLRLAVDELAGVVEARMETLGGGSAPPILGVRSLRLPATTTGYVERRLRALVPGGAARIVVALELSGTGRMRVDRVRARKMAAPQLPEDQNLLANPSLEEGLEGWERFGEEQGATIRATPEAAHSGSTGASIARASAAGPRVLPNVGQEVICPCFTESKVEVSGWFRPHALTGKAFLGLFFYGVKEGAPFTKFVPLDQASVSGDEGWVRLKQEIDLRGKLDVQGIVVRACLDGTGAVDVDDLSLRIVPAEGRPSRRPILGIAAALAALIAASLAWRRRGRKPATT